MPFFTRRKLKISIPKPCQENWHQMDGTAQERFCAKCRSSVIDFSALTRKEAERLLKSAKGPICGRLVHDPQGDIVFRPDPGAGNFARVAGLSLTAISGLAAQSTCELKIQAKDITGAVITHANVSTKPGTKSGETNSHGAFSTQLEPGHYQLEVQSPGFETFRRAEIEVACSNQQPTVVEATLNVGSMGGIAFEVAPFAAKQKSKKR